MIGWRGALAAVLAASAVALSAGGCKNINVRTEAYATLAEAQAAGAVDRGWLPRGLPPGTRELRVAHDGDSNGRWGLFDFPPEQGDALRTLVGPEISFDGLECNPPGRIEWWPILLRQRLDGFKVPKAVIVVDELPKTSTGKIQKNVVRDRHAAHYES